MSKGAAKLIAAFVSFAVVGVVVQRVGISAVDGESHVVAGVGATRDEAPVLLTSGAATTSTTRQEKFCRPISVPLLSRVSFPAYAYKLREHMVRHNAIHKDQPFRVVEIGSLYCLNVYSFRRVLNHTVPPDVNIEFYSVDAWGYRGKEIGLNDHNDEKQGLRNMKYCQDLLNLSFPDTRLVRRKSVDAAALFLDGFFDFVYIDALHTLDAAQNDMEAWWPKTRPGGLFAGDDFGDEMISHLATWDAWGYVNFKWGVVRAVETFGKRHNVEIHVTSHEHKMHHNLLDMPKVPLPKGGVPGFWKPMRGAPNWYTVKPHPAFDLSCVRMINDESWIRSLDSSDGEKAKTRSRS